MVAKPDIRPGLVVVVDYGMGNLRSVAKALEHVKQPAQTVMITADPQLVYQAERVVLPGQGAMPDCMQGLKASGLLEAVMDAAKQKPLFGVCVGEQMLLDHSEEGDVPGLGLIPGRVQRFQVDPALKIPHMGWNKVYRNREHPLWQGIPQGAYFYFVHSYYVKPENEGDSAAYSDYGQRFTAAVAHANIFATQFHPEKSSDHGLRLYQNFMTWKP